MVVHVVGATPWGIDARPVRVEAGTPASTRRRKPLIVGFPKRAAREVREKIGLALRSAGVELLPRPVVLDISPSSLALSRNHLELPLALALLAAHGKIPCSAFEGRLIAGELGLDGSVRAVSSGLATAELARRLEIDEVLLPAASAVEAALRGVVRCIPVHTLTDAIEHLTGACTAQPASPETFLAPELSSVPDLSDVRGQEGAKRALEVAAAGGHHLLFIGPPGSGKTMLARCLPGLLPTLTRAEALTVAQVHSVLASRPLGQLPQERPFLAPLPTINPADLLGGGSALRPGEVSLAHNGVLLLDDVPEFRRDNLVALRQALDQGLVTVAGTIGRRTFPARVALIATMKPCPCGHLQDPRRSCHCTPHQVRRYRDRVNPLLDLIDLHVEVPAVGLAELRDRPRERSAAVAERIEAARAVQRERFGATASPINAAMIPDEVARYAPLDVNGQRLLDTAFERLALSAQVRHRVLKVSRTIADLAGDETIRAPHVAEAIQYQTSGQSRPETNHNASTQ